MSIGCEFICSELKTEFMKHCKSRPLLFPPSRIFDINTFRTLMILVPSDWFELDQNNQNPKSNSIKNVMSGIECDLTVHMLLIRAGPKSPKSEKYEYCTSIKNVMSANAIILKKCVHLDWFSQNLKYYYWPRLALFSIGWI